MRATLTTVAAVALLATGAGPASARTDTPTRHEPGPAPIVHITRVADQGFDWPEAGIGAALTAALLLTAAGGVSTLRRQHASATR